MYSSTILSVVLASLAASALATPVNLTIQQQLELAGTAVDRLALLPDDSAFVYDFFNSTAGITAGKGMYK
jgi:hypothetical protein